MRVEQLRFGPSLTDGTHVSKIATGVRVQRLNLRLILWRNYLQPVEPESPTFG